MNDRDDLRHLPAVRPTGLTRLTAARQQMERLVRAARVLAHAPTRLGVAAMRRRPPHTVLLLRLAMLTITVAVLASCTRAAEPDPDPGVDDGVPPATDGTDDSDDASTIDPLPDPQPTRHEQALELWEAFHTERHAQLTSDDQPDPTRFAGLATDDAAEAVADLISIGRGELPFVITDVEYWPQVEIPATADVATIQDCILVAEQPADRPDLDPTVKSQVWTGTLTATDDGWLVDEIAPGIDNCVPRELNQQLQDAYAKYHDARNAAWDPPAPDHPRLVQTMTGARLDNFRALLGEHASEGITVRDPHDPRENAVVFELGVGQATVSDCHTAHPEYGAYDVETGERLDELIPPIEPGQLNLVSVDLVRTGDGIWKVAESAGLDDSNCAPRGTDYVVEP